MDTEKLEYEIPLIQEAENVFKSVYSGGITKPVDEPDIGDGDLQS